MPNKFSDQLRHAILNGDKSRYRIAKETGIGQPALSRFVHGERGLTVENIDLICECLGLRLTTEQKPKRRKGK